MGVKERKEKERLRYRNDIIDAAEEVFFSEGINCATMDKIASVAEVSKATLYTHFRSKDELIYAVHLRGAEIYHLLQQKQLAGQGDIKQTIRALLETVVVFQREYPDYFDLVFYLAVNKITVDPESEDVKRDRQINEILLEEWIDLIEKGKKEGVIRKDLNPLNAGIIMGIQMNGFIKMYTTYAKEIEERYPVSLEQLIEEYFKVVFNGIWEESSSNSN